MKPKYLAFLVSIALALTACSGAPSVDVEATGQTKQALSGMSYSAFMLPGTGLCLGMGVINGGYAYLRPCGDLNEFPTNSKLVPVGVPAGNFAIQQRIQSASQPTLCISTQQKPSNGINDVLMDLCTAPDTILQAWGGSIRDSSGSMCLLPTPGSAIENPEFDDTADRISWQSCSGASFTWTGIGYYAMFSTADLSGGLPIYVSHLSGDSCEFCMSGQTSSAILAGGIYQPTANEVFLSFLDASNLSASFTPFGTFASPPSSSPPLASWVAGAFTPELQMGSLGACPGNGSAQTVGSWTINQQEQGNAPYEVYSACAHTHWYSFGTPGDLGICANNSCGGTSRDGSSMLVMYR